MLTYLNRRLARLVAAGIALLALSAGLPAIAHAAPSVALASAEPAQIVIGQASPVRFSADIGDPSLIAGSVNLLRVGLPGTNPTIVGRLHDDGLNSDAIAGDKRYSIELTLNQPAAGQVVYRISAAFKGMLQRVKSNDIVVEVVASPPPDSGAPAASIELRPQAILLTAPGERKALTAVVRSADGRVIPGVVSYTSSDPAVVSVNEAGLVQALATHGTVLVTASVDDVQSEPVYVSVAAPVPGAQLLTDRQIVSGPTAVDPTAEPAFDNPYEVVLRGVPSMPLDTILINTEALSVAGRVVDVQPQGNDLRVRLVVVPPEQLFSDFEFKDSVDLSKMPFETPADIAALYDVERKGNTFVFTPKPTATSTFTDPLFTATLAPQTAALQAATETPTLPIGNQTPLPPLPPFADCQAKAGFGSGLPLLPFALSTPPAFTLDINAKLEREFTSQGKKIILRGTPTFTLSTVLEMKTAFEAKIECKATLHRMKVLAPGWPGLFLGGDVAFGAGFELGGKVTLASAKVGGTAKLKTTIEAGVVCPIEADCALTGNVTADTEVKPVLELSPSLDQAQFEPSLSLFGFATAELGNAYIKQLQFSALEAKAGAKLSARYTVEALQITNTDPEKGRSKYDLSFEGEAGPGIKLGELLAYIGLKKFVPLKFTFALPLGESPTGKVTANRAKYLPGEPVTMQVKLDAASTLFPAAVGYYNVDRVVVLRKTGILSTETLATQTASEGQTEFNLTFNSSAPLEAKEMFAFLVPKFLPLDPPKLEIGAALCSNNPPTAVNDTASTTLNTPVKIDVKANDTGPDGLPLNQLVFSALRVVDPSKGNVKENPDGTITFTPADNVTGDVVIEYALKDSCGTISNTAKLTVTIAVVCEIIHHSASASASAFCYKDGNRTHPTLIETRVQIPPNGSYLYRIYVMDGNFSQYRIDFSDDFGQISKRIFDKEGFDKGFLVTAMSFFGGVYHHKGQSSRYDYLEYWPNLFPKRIKTLSCEDLKSPSMNNGSHETYYSENGVPIGYYNGAPLEDFLVNIKRNLDPSECVTYAQVNALFPFEFADSILYRNDHPELFPVRIKP